jgi:AraC-like DNA-binding protein
MLRPPTDRDTVPGSYALNLLSLVARWQVSAADLLAGHSLSEAQLEEPSARVSLATMNALASRAKRLTGEPGLGFYLGMQKRISMYGYLGFAMMTAGTVRECLELAVQFTPILTSAVILRLDQGCDAAAVVIDQQIDMGDADDVANISLVVGLTHLGVALTGRQLPGVAEFEMPEPSYYARFQHVLPGARFAQASTRVIFDRSTLQVTLATADRAAMRKARAECERAFAELDVRIGARVWRALRAGVGLRGIEEVAADLGVSPRTLSRRLAQQGLSFAQIAKRERRERALEMLSEPSVSLEDVTEQLGYSTVPCFVRAFRQWMGTTPGAYRRLHQAARVQSLRQATPSPERTAL